MRALASLILLAACGAPTGPVPAPVVVGSAPPPSASVASVSAPCDQDSPQTPAPTGAKPDLPPVPTLSIEPDKEGDAWTVRGAVHALKSRFDAKNVTSGDITIVGWIADSNVPRAPKCAWHKTGVPDPPGCTTEIPSFVIADAKDAKLDDATPHIKVLGWAKNFATVFDATTAYKGLLKPPSKLVMDDQWQVEVPFPIPERGRKVKVTGRYGFAFTKASTGLVADPRNGILTYRSLEGVP